MVDRKANTPPGWDLAETLEDLNAKGSISPFSAPPFCLRMGVPGLRHGRSYRYVDRGHLMDTQAIQTVLPWFEGQLPLAPVEPEPFTRFMVEPTPSGLSRVTFAESANTGRVGLGSEYQSEPEARALAEALTQLDPVTTEHAQRMAEELPTEPSAEVEPVTITRPGRYAGSCWPVLITFKGKDYSRTQNMAEAQAIAAYLETLPC